MTNKFAQVKRRREEARKQNFPDRPVDVEGILKTIAENRKPTEEERRAKQNGRKEGQKKPKVTLTDAQVWQLNHAPREPQVQKKADEFESLRTLNAETAKKEVSRIVGEIKEGDLARLERVTKRIEELLEGKISDLFEQGAVVAQTMPRGRELHRLICVLENLAGRRIISEQEIELIKRAGEKCPISSATGIAIRNALNAFEREGPADEKKWVAKVRKGAIPQVKERARGRVDSVLVESREEAKREEREKSDRRAKLRKDMRAVMREAGASANERLTTVLEEYQKLLPDWSDRVDEEDKKHLGIIARNEKLGSASEKAREILKGLKLSWELHKEEASVDRQTRETEPQQQRNWDPFWWLT